MGIVTMDSDDGNNISKTEAENFELSDDTFQSNDNENFVAEEKVECEICYKGLPMSHLRSHILTEHCGGSSKKKVFICSICNSEFTAKTTLKHHVQSVHVGNYTKSCPECHKEVSVMNFKRHIKEKHRQEKKECPYCDKEFGMSNLRKHIRGVHDKEQHFCKLCGKCYTTTDNLRSHIKSAHMKVMKTCDICNEEIPFLRLSVHKRVVHNLGSIWKNENTNRKQTNSEIHAELYSDLNLGEDVQIQIQDEEVKQMTVNGKVFNFQFVEDV